MARRNHIFEIDEFYHCYNRGVDKRVVYKDAQDYSYFLRSLKAYNSTETLGKLRLHDTTTTGEKIVEVVSMCLLPNHFHLILEEKIDSGISKFMQRVGIGYSMYFNEKYKRSGSLFQGAFKSRHIEGKQNFDQVLAYVTHNYMIHNLSDPTKYRSILNQNHKLVRDPNSNLEPFSNLNMIETVEIIKELRLSLD